MSHNPQGADCIFLFYNAAAGGICSACARPVKLCRRIASELYGSALFHGLAGVGADSGGKLAAGGDQQTADCHAAS